MEVSRAKELPEIDRARRGLLGTIINHMEIGLGGNRGWYLGDLTGFLKVFGISGEYGGVERERGLLESIHKTFFRTVTTAKCFGYFIRHLSLLERTFIFLLNYKK